MSPSSISANGNNTDAQQRLVEIRNDIARGLETRNIIRSAGETLKAYPEIADS